MKHVDKLKEHTKKQINNEHRRTKYHWLKFGDAITAEFEKPYALRYGFINEISKERKLWSAFFALGTGDPEFTHAFLYLQYAIFLEQRPSFTDGHIHLSYNEHRAMWYALRKAEGYAKQGSLDAMTDSIKLDWNEYDRKRKRYWKSRRQPKYQDNFDGPSEWEE